MDPRLFVCILRISRSEISLKSSISIFCYKSHILNVSKCSKPGVQCISATLGRYAFIFTQLHTRNDIFYAQ